MGDYIEIYNPGMVVVRAWFIGFVEHEQTKEKCNHASCGYVKGEASCPHCGNLGKHSNRRGFKEGWEMHNFLICKKHGHTRWSKKGEYGRVIEPKKSERLCPKCKKERQYAWRHECNKCGKLFYNTKGVGGTGPIKCKQRDRFRVMSTKKMSNPEQEIHFAAIRADVFHQNDMARATVLVANLKDEKFLEGRWADNGSCIYRTEQLDTSDILNADKLIKLMWEQI